MMVSSFSLNRTISLWLDFMLDFPRKLFNVILPSFPSLSIGTGKKISLDWSWISLMSVASSSSNRSRADASPNQPYFHFQICLLFISHEKKTFSVVSDGSTDSFKNVHAKAREGRYIHFIIVLIFSTLIFFPFTIYKTQRFF